MSGALAGLVILVIGDSHMSHMMTNLHNQLENDGAAVHSYFMCGATAGDWVYPSQVASWAGCVKGEHHEHDPVVLDNQKLTPTYSAMKLIAQYHPDLVVVQSGDAMVSSAQFDRAWLANQVHVLTGKLAAANVACDWVGPIWGQDKPPHNKTEAETRELAQLLATSVSPCRYIDSTGFARPGEWPTVDGSHLTPDGYRKWSAHIADAVVRLKSPGLASSR
jgi:hypothetical protein